MYMRKTVKERRETRRKEGNLFANEARNLFANEAKESVPNFIPRLKRVGVTSSNYPQLKRISRTQTPTSQISTHLFPIQGVA